MILHMELDSEHNDIEIMWSALETRLLDVEAALRTAREAWPEMEHEKVRLTELMLQLGRQSDDAKQR